MNAAVAAATALPAENPTFDFTQDPAWLVVVKALVIFVFLVVNTLIMIWAERRVVGGMQSRPGPNRTGPFGLLQSLADGVKLALKEDVIPKGADRVVFVLAPIIAATTCWLAFAVIPFGPEVTIPGTDVVTPLQLTDLPVAVLYILAVTSIGVYGIVLAGWSSGSTYPLLGGVRSSAQVISYEIAMGLSLIAVFLYSGAMSTTAIVDAQTQVWWGVALFPAFVIYLISMVGETNRAPFDLPEAEGELVGGFHTEYSSLKFALFFLAEYVNMMTVAAVAVTLFLGGWRAPWPISAINDGMFNEGWWPVLWFLVKLWMFLFVFIWLRGTLPRMRYDQFMRFGWKLLIPAALGLIVVYSVIRAINEFDLIAGGSRTPLIIGSLVVLVALGIWSFLVPEEKDAGAPDEEAELDPYAGGYPVPPMPGQRLLRSSGSREAPALTDDASQEVRGG